MYVTFQVCTVKSVKSYDSDAMKVNTCTHTHPHMHVNTHTYNSKGGMFLDKSGKEVIDLT